MMPWLHEQHIIGTYVTMYCNTGLNKTDMDTKSHGGQILQQKHVCLVGYKYYPENGTLHYKVLGLGKYNICIHMGSFLLDTARAVYKKIEQ